VVPYLLGFTPANSVVTLCLRNNRLGLTQRLDLPRPEDAHDGLFRLNRATCFSRLRPAGIGGYTPTVSDGAG
jgi:hypothetical protein